MMKAQFCISVDNKWDRHISIPGREPNLPDWLTVEHFNQSVYVSLYDLSQIVEHFKYETSFSYYNSSYSAFKLWVTFKT